MRGRGHAPAGKRPAAARGFTLLELMIVVSILAIISAIGVPQYVSALRTARIGKAKHELVTISNAVQAFAANNDGRLPLTLHQVGFGQRRDPWGTPYCYLNYGDGTGDGLQWAIANGLVDPSAFRDNGAAAGGSAPSAPTPPSGGAGGAGPAPKRIGVLPMRVRLPQGADADAAFKRTDALTKATEIGASIGRILAPTEVESLADAILGSNGFGVFVGVDTDTTRRRDRYMFPLNTDFDLFSLGPDARTAASLGESVGLDDVIRANNGGFFGVASEY